MNFWYSIPLFLTLNFVTADNGILILEINDFKERLGKIEFALVIFHKLGCPYCEKALPEFDKAWDILKASNSPAVFAKYECGDETKVLCREYSIRSYPSIHIFRYGEIGEKFEWHRLAEKFVKFVNKNLGPSSKDLASLEELEKFLTKDDGGVVGCFENETELKGSYLKVADKLRGQVRLGQSSSIAVLEKLGTKNGIVIFLPKHKENNLKPVQYSGTDSMDKVEEFITDTLKIVPKGTNDGVTVKVLYPKLQILTMILTCVWFYF